MIQKILIANRGEIARRIARTCDRLGIASVAVYSEADRGALHAREAREAVEIGPPQSRDSYLRIDRILEAARRTGCDAVHPGYGFLSENAEFAACVLHAGLKFIGPIPDAIRKMGLKSTARAIAAAAQVPTVPGYNGEDQDDATLAREARRIGFPVLIKASAGGGGKGMRLVRSEGDLAEALQAARREAASAFGNGDLLLEKYIERARHVEIQILGDLHGNLIHLGERECSIQRRHQKIIEESPSPAVSDHLRARMGEAAVSIGKAIGYSSAGTVEFLLAPGGDFYFIEVNTRIQVEHPVTEAVTGLDLVELQIGIAEGHPLPLTQEQIHFQGHAIEARLYAEDPANDFLPSTGRVHSVRFPDRVRVDHAIEQGSDVTVYYDPMLAKLIAHGGTRPEALRTLRAALAETRVLGVTTNRDFLLRVLADAAFQKGDTHTGLLAEMPAAANDTNGDAVALAVTAVYLDQAAIASRAFLKGIPANFRNNPYRDPVVKLERNGQTGVVSWRSAGDLYQVQIGDASLEVRVLEWREDRLRAEVDGLQATFDFAREGDRLWIESPRRSDVIVRAPRYPAASGAAEQETANAPMPGLVLRIPVEIGQEVHPGQPLVILEAMKMEQTIRAGVHGSVQSILVKVGDIVAPGQMLIEIGALAKEAGETT